jgi:glutaredoxin
MGKLTGKDYSIIRLSFPVVFYEDIFIGGYNDTVEYLNTNVENNRFGA